MFNWNTDGKKWKKFGLIKDSPDFSLVNARDRIPSKFIPPHGLFFQQSFLTGQAPVINNSLNSNLKENPKNSESLDLKAKNEENENFLSEDFSMNDLDYSVMRTKYLNFLSNSDCLLLPNVQNESELLTS